MNFEKLTLDNLNMQFCSFHLKEQIRQILEENATLRHEFKMLQAGASRQSQENQKVWFLLMRCLTLLSDGEEKDAIWWEIDEMAGLHR